MKRIFYAVLVVLIAFVAFHTCYVKIDSWQSYCDDILNSDRYSNAQIATFDKDAIQDDFEQIYSKTMTKLFLESGIVEMKGEIVVKSEEKTLYVINELEPVSEADKQRVINAYFKTIANTMISVLRTESNELDNEMTTIRALYNKLCFVSKDEPDNICVDLKEIRGF